jgi:hypothetical protein
MAQIVSIDYDPPDTIIEVSAQKKITILRVSGIDLEDWYKFTLCWRKGKHLGSQICMENDTLIFGDFSIPAKDCLPCFANYSKQLREEMLINLLDKLNAQEIAEMPLNSYFFSTKKCHYNRQCSIFAKSNGSILLSLGHGSMSLLSRT